MKAQELTAREKAYHFFYHWDNPDFRKARLNPLRRIWQVGLSYQHIAEVSCVAELDSYEYEYLFYQVIESFLYRLYCVV